MVNVGGFFASLKLVTDEDSFKKGLGVLNAFPDMLKKGAVGVLGLGAAMVGLGTVTANSMTSLAAMAKQLGMNAMTLDNWQNAVKLAGGDSESFTASIVAMNEAFRNLKIGEVKEDFIKATGMSGADFSKLQGMNNDQRLRTIWGALEKVQDPGKQQALIQKIFGQGGVDLFSHMQLQGTTLSTLYSQAAARNPNTQADYDAAIQAAKDNASIMVSFEKSLQKLGIEFEKVLIPNLDSFASWLVSNKDTLTAFAQAVGGATSALLTLIGFLGGDKKAQANLESGMLGGEVNAAVFRRLEQARGIKSGSSEESMMFLTEWSNPEYQSMIAKANGLAKTTKMTPEQIAATVFQQNQADKVRGLFAGTGVSDAVLSGLYEAREKARGTPQFLNEKDYAAKQLAAVQKAEITLKIDGRQPLSAAQNKQIMDALTVAGIISIRQ